MARRAMRNRSGFGLPASSWASFSSVVTCSAGPWAPVTQIQVHAYAQTFAGWRGHFEPETKGGAVGQDGSAGDHAVAVGFGDAAIYTFGPAEIVRVHDEIFQRERISCPQGQLFFRWRDGHLYH